ncbi:MAG TPA: N-acetylmuramoyl-L-alanine amidase [Thermoanaerobaculia bacterium]|nr:N-acetylmuramoyl-L-alanine amidase [Thermoanaerobaculia bacterium]
MRAGTIDRVKRQLLHEAVSDNVDTIRGLPPRSKRRNERTKPAWFRTTPLLLLPLTLLGASYFMSGAPATSPKPISKTPPRAAALHTAMVDSTELVKAAAFPLAVKRVVLDAGHGGKDAGASSASLLSEKEITLDIERRLRLLLEHNGFEVVATRTDDRLIPLRDRARIANGSDSDIFISIHVNSLRSHTISHGVETYYLGPTKDPLLTQLAAEENGTSGYSIADLRKLLERVYADVRRDESRRLAASVQDQLYSDLRTVDPGLENWGVKRAPFIVLVATEMPAVLAEVGCLSNDREAAMLNQPHYRQQIAQALFRGICEYSRKGT